MGQQDGAQAGPQMALAKAVKAHSVLRAILGDDDAMVKALAAAEAAARAEVEAEAAQEAVEVLRAKLEDATIALADANEDLESAQGELDSMVVREAITEARVASSTKAVETAPHNEM